MRLSLQVKIFLFPIVSVFINQKGQKPTAELKRHWIVESCQAASKSIPDENKKLIKINFPKNKPKCLTSYICYKYNMPKQKEIMILKSDHDATK